MRRTIALAVSIAAAVCSCGGSTERQWTDIDQFRALGRLEPLPVADRVIFQDDVFHVAESAEDGCVQVSVHDVLLDCLINNTGSFGSSTMTIETDTFRYVDIRTSPDAAAFVVWSDVSPNGRNIEPIRTTNNSVLLWKMAPGEAPWGVQMLTEDGALGAHATLVGLPGD